MLPWALARQGLRGYFEIFQIKIEKSRIFSQKLTKNLSKNNIKSWKSLKAQRLKHSMEASRCASWKGLRMMPAMAALGRRPHWTWRTGLKIPQGRKNGRAAPWVYTEQALHGSCGKTGPLRLWSPSETCVCICLSMGSLLRAKKLKSFRPKGYLAYWDTLMDL